MIEAWQRALVLAPHTDDGEFGCGGTMARLVEAGCEVRYVAFSIATRSLPEGFPPDTLAREVREATAEIGIPESQLTVHDFDVRTFPERRQDILDLLVALWEEWRPAVDPASLRGVFATPGWLRDAGFTAWMLVGVVLLTTAVIALLGLTYTIVAPLLTATVIAFPGKQEMAVARGAARLVLAIAMGWLWLRLG